MKPTLEDLAAVVEGQFARIKDVESALANGAYYADDPECHPCYRTLVAARQIIEKVWKDCAEAAMASARAQVEVEYQAREEGLEFDQHGAMRLHVVWALKPGQPQIVAICRSEEIAERYKSHVGAIVAGSIGHIEQVWLDHAFGRRDVQSTIYRSASRNPRARAALASTEVAR